MTPEEIKTLLAVSIIGNVILFILATHLFNRVTSAEDMAAYWKREAMRLFNKMTDE